MQKVNNEAIILMNYYGAKREPFVFMLNYDGSNFKVLKLDEIGENIKWRTSKYSNFSCGKHFSKEISWKTEPIKYENYLDAFNFVHNNILKGNSYLTNLTFPTRLNTNLSLKDIAENSKSPYLIYVEDDFVCFSPEIFVRIEENKIKSFPMKGTIDASVEDAEYLLKSDIKEMAEHNTIVDLIRNDLSMVSEDVNVDRFAYIDEVETNCGTLLQMSSEISGTLSDNWHENIGNIFAELLPAGSITGAPKDKTIDIINKAENYNRGWYTGVFGIYDGEAIDSCVMIRFIEKQTDGMVFKSGGGITNLSICKDEYDELIKKVYVPIIRNNKG